MKLIDAKTMLKELIKKVETRRLKAERRDRKHYEKKEYEASTWFHGQRHAWLDATKMLKAKLDELDRQPSQNAHPKRAAAGEKQGHTLG